MFSTTELTSGEISSDNVIHQRLLFAYEEAAKMVSGDVLELGCGFGRGLELLMEKCASYTGIDKNERLVAHLGAKYPKAVFLNLNIPPLPFGDDKKFDFILTFQVIEHIEDDRGFLAEIAKFLKPGGKIILSTPNIVKSLTRNPWHVREYTASELQALLSGYFADVKVSGVTGSEKVMRYFEENKKSVQKITRFDVLDLQHRLPRSILQIPYDFLNRLNRKKLAGNTGALVADISTADYRLSEVAADGFDLFCVGNKK